MKYFLLTIALAVFALEANAQANVSVRGGQMTESPFSNSERGYKFVITDTTAKAVNVLFNIEQYEKNIIDTTSLLFSRSFKSKLVFDVAPTIRGLDKALEAIPVECARNLMILFRFPGSGSGSSVCSKEGYQFKWRVFAASEEKENVPLILIYQDKEGEDVVEKKISAWFGNADIAITKNEVIRKIKPVIEKYWIFTYNLKQKNDE
jgi:hypothetical protein